MAETTNTPSRRKFLGHIAGGAAIVAVAAGTARICEAAQLHNPDAELIALCAELSGYVSEFDQTIAADKNGDPPLSILGPIHVGIDEVGALILSKRATTPEGYKAFAAALALYAPEMLETVYFPGKPDEEEHCLSQRLLAKLLRDVASFGDAAGGAA